MVALDRTLGDGMAKVICTHAKRCCEVDVKIRCRHSMAHDEINTSRGPCAESGYRQCLPTGGDRKVWVKCVKVDR